MNHPYAIPTTSRDPAATDPTSAAVITNPTSSSTRSPSVSTSSTTNALPMTATPMSGSVSRKLVVDPVHGHTREETREERRARKERERQLRDSPSLSSSSKDPSTTVNPASTSSSTSTSNANSNSTSSKSVLTIALQRAQSAVLLDSANNFPAAISAYSQSVRLLKEVMARVESKGLTGTEMERKSSTASNFSLLSSGSSSTSAANLVKRENETVEEWEKRKHRWEKKEKAKAGEARRLRVIHDTYEDRIKMLLAMNPSLASSVSPSIAAAVLPTSTSNPTRVGGSSSASAQSNGQNPSSPTTASMRFHRRRSSTEQPRPLQTQPRHRSTPSTSSATSASASSRPASPSSALSNLGQAMMSTDLASPTSPMAPPNGIPRIAQLPVISPSNSLHNMSSARLQQDTSYLSHLNLNPPPSRPVSTASDSTARALPFPSSSGTSTPTAPVSSATSTLSRPLPPPTSSLPLPPPGPPPPAPSHPPPPIPINSGRENQQWGSKSSDESDLDENGEKRIPVTALEYGQDWPRQVREGGPGSGHVQKPGQRDSELRLPVVDRDPLATDSDRTQTSSRPETPPPLSGLHSLPSAPLTSNRQNIFPLAERSNSNHSSPMRRGSSASAVYTLQSSSSSSRPLTNYSLHEERGGSVNPFPSSTSAAMAMRRTMSSEGPNPSSILRPARSASLASQGGLKGPVYSSGMVPSLSAGSHQSTNSSFSILGNYAQSTASGGGGGTEANVGTAAQPQIQDETGSGLVSSSTAGGTISQRRLAATTPIAGDEYHSNKRDQQDRLAATIVVRAPSQESYRSSGQSQVQAPSYDEFGSRSQAAGGGGTGASGYGSFPGRLRALSQPSQKRPKLPLNTDGPWNPESTSFNSSSPPSAGSPPVPPLLSQAPPASLNTTVSQRHHSPSLSISSNSNAGTRKPSVSTPTSLNAPAFPSTLGRSNSSSSVGSSASGRYSDRSMPPPVPSTTSTSLHSNYQVPPSANYGNGAIPAHRSSTNTKETVLSFPPVRRPFHLMRLVLATMPSNPNATSPSTARSSVISLAPSGSNMVQQAGGGGGGYLSEKLYVPCQIWSIPGSKLVSLETKVRMMEIVLSSLSQLSLMGQSLLSPALANTARNSGSGGERWCVEEAARFLKELENFEGVVEGVQNTLSKKLGGGLIHPTGGGIGHSTFNDKEFGGFGTGAGGGAAHSAKDTGGGVGSANGKDAKKGSTSGGQFSSWSSKFQRGLDRVTNANGVSLDSQTTYVETIGRLCRQSQFIDHHLALLLSASSSSSPQTEGSAYALLPLSEKHRLERQLRRASEFFGTVICRFVMKDIGLLLDKYVKRGGAWLSGE